MGILRAIWDAVGGQVDQLAGRSFSRLVAPLSATDTASLQVESTIGFGERVDGAGDALLLVNGELISATGRTTSAPFTFTTLARAVDNTKAKAHPAGSLVVDVSGNRSAIDLARRGFLVRTATDADLDIIGRNLGLHRCSGVATEPWRRLIQAIAFAPKGVIDVFEEALTALYGSSSSFEVLERLVSNPHQVFVRVATSLASDIRGRFILTGGIPAKSSNSTTTVTPLLHGAPMQLRTVLGVYLDTPLARRGYRSPEGLVNYLDSFVVGGSVIVLSPAPGPIGTSLLVDAAAYGAGSPSDGYHYLATDETVVDDGDRYGYFADATRIARCLVSQLRSAGSTVVVGTL